jgi:hypothetical protein
MISLEMFSERKYYTLIMTGIHLLWDFLLFPHATTTHNGSVILDPDVPNRYKSFRDKGNNIVVYVLRTQADL